MSRRKLITLGLALGSAAALAGAGGGLAFLRKPVGAVFVALWLIWWSALTLGRQGGRRSRYTRAQRLVVVSGAAMLLLTLLFVPWEYAHLAGPLPRDGLLAWAGLALFAAGVGVQIAAFRALGALCTTRMSLQDQHRLVTGGPYRVVRHPVYLGYFITFVGMALAMSSLIGFGITAVVAALLVRRIREEEAVLAGIFPNAHAGYRERTRWRLVPWVY